jgi:hypothetical protein
VALTLLPKTLLAGKRMILTVIYVAWTRKETPADRAKVLREAASVLEECPSGATEALRSWAKSVRTVRAADMQQDKKLSLHDGLSMSRQLINRPLGPGVSIGLAPSRLPKDQAKFLKRLAEHVALLGQKVRAVTSMSRSMQRLPAHETLLMTCSAIVRTG